MYFHQVVANTATTVTSLTMELIATIAITDTRRPATELVSVCKWFRVCVGAQMCKQLI